MIDSYDFGSIVVDGKRHTSDIILLPDGRTMDWWRESGHYLQTQDLDEVAKGGVRLLIIGTGYSGVMRVAPDVRTFLEGKGIELVACRSRDACELYNKRHGEGGVALGIHLTC